MSEFTGFPFSNSASSSTPSFVFGSSSTPSFGSFGSSFSMPNFGSSSSSPFVSSSATPSFGSSSSSSSSSSSFSSSAPNPNNDEAMIKNIIEAIELLEKKSENGVFPQKKLQEIKQEVQNKYPNIFSTQNYTQKNQEFYGNHHLLAQQQQMMSQIQKMEQQRKNQQELYVNHFLAQQQQMNQYIQSQMNSQIQRMEQQMKIFGQTAPGFSPNYYGVNYPNYNSNYGNNYPIYHNSNYVDEVNNLFGNYSGLGSDGYTALSFLGSLIGGGLGL